MKRIILGTVQFGLDYGIANKSGKPSTKEVTAILDCAVANDVRMLDTAEAYGDSQEVIGQYHRASSNRFDIITKYSPGRKDLPSDIVLRVEHDIKTLGVESLYGYMFHSFQDFERSFGTFRRPLGELRSAGRIRKLGVSVYSNEEVEALLGVKEIDLIQIPFNLLDNANLRGAVLKAATNRGIEVHTRSVFLQGLFFRELSLLSNRLKPLEPHLAQIAAIANRANVSISDLSLHYALHQSFIDCMLIGVDTRIQLEENLRAIEVAVPNSALSEIDKIRVEDTTLLNPSTWR